jgi:hypothetical protein
MASNWRIDVQKFDGSRDVSRKSRNNNWLSLSPTRYGDATAAIVIAAARTADGERGRLG